MQSSIIHKPLVCDSPLQRRVTDLMCLTCALSPRCGNAGALHSALPWEGSHVQEVIALAELLPEGRKQSKRKVEEGYGNKS